MPRRLLNFLTALSLRLCVAVLVLWVRAGFVADQIIYNRVYPSVNGTLTTCQECIILSARGDIVVLCSRYEFQWGRTLALGGEYDSQSPPAGLTIRLARARSVPRVLFALRCPECGRPAAAPDSR